MILCRFKTLLAEREIAERRRISLGEVQRVTGIATSTLSTFANNQTTRYDANTLSRLCKYFGCQVGDLLMYAEE